MHNYGQKRSSGSRLTYPQTHIRVYFSQRGWWCHSLLSYKLPPRQCAVTVMRQENQLFDPSDLENQNKVADVQKNNVRVKWFSYKHANNCQWCSVHEAVSFCITLFNNKRPSNIIFLEYTIEPIDCVMQQTIFLKPKSANFYVLNSCVKHFLHWSLLKVT